VLRAAAGVPVDAPAWGRAFASQQGADPSAALEPAPHLPPYAMVVLDRLIGVLRAQGRGAHALPLQRTFLDLAAAFPCPVGLHAARAGATHLQDVFLGEPLQPAPPIEAGSYDPSRAGPAGMCRPPWQRSPWARVLGHAVPYALGLATEKLGSGGDAEVPA